MARKIGKNPLGLQKNSKMTPEVIRKLKTAFMMGCNVKEARQYAGVSSSTFYDWKKREPELSEELEDFRVNPVLVAKASLMKGIKDNPNLALKFLERFSLSRGEFGLRTENINTNVTLEEVLAEFEDPDKR